MIHHPSIQMGRMHSNYYFVFSCFLLYSTTAANITVMVNDGLRTLSTLAEIEAAVTEDFSVWQGGPCAVLSESGGRARCTIRILHAELQKASVRDALLTTDVKDQSLAAAVLGRLSSSRSFEMIFRGVALESDELTRAAFTLLSNSTALMANLTRDHINYVQQHAQQEENHLEAAKGDGSHPPCAVTVATSLRPQVM
jgi:hypothetical protein